MSNYDPNNPSTFEQSYTGGQATGGGSYMGGGYGGGGPAYGGAPPPPSGGPGNASGQGSTYDTDHWYNPFSWGNKGKAWNVDPGAYSYQTGGLPQWDAAAQQMSATRMGEEERAGQVAMLNLMNQRARGQGLVSQMEAARQLEQGMGAISGQTAKAMRGGYDPAAQRAASYSAAALGGNVASSAAINAAKEQQEWATKYMQSAQGIRETDIDQQMRANQLANQLRQMGMDDKKAELYARMALEQAKYQAFMGITNQNSGFGGVLGGVGGGLLAGAASGWNPQAISAGYSAGSKAGESIGKMD